MFSKRAPVQFGNVRILINKLIKIDVAGYIYSNNLGKRDSLH